jgi:hypothetical protein
VARASGATLVLAALALAGCSGSGSALEETARNLDDIRSGELALKAGVTPDGPGEAFSYELRGRFEFPEGGGVASADLRYQQTRGAATEEARLFVAQGKGWIEVNGDRRPLTGAQLQALVVGPDDQGFLEDLDIDDWYVRSETRDGPDGTLVITGDAHAGRTLEGVMGLGGGLGESGPMQLDEEAEQRVDRIARSSRLEVVTGSDDHLLRRLQYDLDLGFDVARELRGALRGLDGARLTFELEIRSPNEPVQITG